MADDVHGYVIENQEMQDAVADTEHYQLHKPDLVTHEQVGRDISALQAVLNAQMDALKERLVDLQHAIERIPIEQRAAVDTAMTAAAKATDAALMAAKAAVDQAAIAHAREHTLIAEALKQQQATYLSDKAQQNEWRTTVETLAGDKMDAKEFRNTHDSFATNVRTQFDGVDTRLKTVENELATTRGTTEAAKTQLQGQMMVFTVIAGTLSLLIAIASVVLSHLWR